MTLCGLALSFAVVITNAFTLGCAKERIAMSGSSNTQTVVTREQAVEIAMADAARVFRNLDDYRATATLDGGQWHVTLELKDPNAQGGGAVYVIDRSSGAIVSKKYYQ